MASQLTVTGKVGPGLDVTAEVITGVKSFCLDTENNMLTVRAGGRTRHIDILAATTLTVTVSGGNYTVSIS